MTYNKEKNQRRNIERRCNWLRLQTASRGSKCSTQHEHAALRAEYMYLFDKRRVGASAVSGGEHECLALPEQRVLIGMVTRGHRVDNMPLMFRRCTLFVSSAVQCRAVCSVPGRPSLRQAKQVVKDAPVCCIPLEELCV